MAVTLTSAARLVLRDGGRVLLLRRHNTGYEDGNYSVVAGHIEEGETPTAAMQSEALEEADIHLDPADLSVAHVMYRRREDGSLKSDLFFLCDRWTGEVRNVEPHKCADLTWYAADDLPPTPFPTSVPLWA